MTVIETGSPGSIRSSSTWIDTVGPVVVGAAGAAVVGAAAGGAESVSPEPGSNALVRFVFGSSAGRLTQFGALGSYWPKNA
jgi:hypothetical protein